MPVTSTTQIANLALSHLGVGIEISDLDTEQSVEAAACRLHYLPTLEALLEPGGWAWAEASATLALVIADPNQEWGYSYRLPVDCLSPLRISTALGEMNPDPVPFRRAADASGGLIWTDEAEAVLLYIQHQTNVALFPPLFVIALTWALAENIAEGLSAKPERAERARQRAEVAISSARAVQGNHSQMQAAPESPFMRARY